MCIRDSSAAVQYGRPCRPGREQRHCHCNRERYWFSWFSDGATFDWLYRPASRIKIFLHDHCHTRSCHQLPHQQNKTGVVACRFSGFKFTFYRLVYIFVLHFFHIFFVKEHIFKPVSYTHLDVYKRQARHRGRRLYVLKF